MARRNRRKPTHSTLQRRRQRLAGGARAAGKLVLLAVLGAGLGVAAWAVMRLFEQAPVLRVRSIEVRGCRRTGLQQVMEASGVRQGMNILDVDMRKSAEAIEKLPWVKSARVTRLVPDRVLVEVTEYRPVALLAASGLYLVDGSATVFKEAEPSDAVDLPVVSGVVSEPAAEGSEDAKRRLREALRMLERIRRLPCLKGKRVEQLHVDDILGPSVILEGGRLMVQLDPEAARRPGLVCQATERLRDMGIGYAWLLVGRSVHGWRATVRPAARAADAGKKEVPSEKRGG
ncbi:MAG: FtsQ-type POTRA domain-containing protein [Deltaproteobacteria bacterium]|nr:MAG: FtsQ-type POTRA domain-containing protein [Deltaproteobacteria bacterium]